MTEAAIPQPWYRDRWPWILMAGPAFVVIGGSYAMWLAKTTEDGLVADDYYKRGMAINRTLERFEHAADLQLGAIVGVSAEGNVRVSLSGAEQFAPASVRLRLVHPTRAGLDRSAELVSAADGVYVGKTIPTGGGRWLLIVETDTWRLPAAETSGAIEHVRLGSAIAR